MLDPFINRIIGQMNVLAEAWTVFVAAMIVVGIIIWRALKWQYESIAAIKDAEIARLRGQREEDKDKLGGATPDQAKARIDGLEARLAAIEPRLLTDAQRAPASSPPNPETEVVFGPYQPEEVKEMILALAKMQDVAEKQLRAALVAITSEHHTWAANFQINRPEDLPEMLDRLGREWTEAVKSLHKIVLEENYRFSQELRPTIEDNHAAEGLGISVREMADNMRSLAGATGADFGYVLAKDAARINSHAHQCHFWLSQIVSRMAKKKRRLRDHKP